jgi:hypothetical protein
VSSDVTPNPSVGLGLRSARDHFSAAFLSTDRHTRDSLENYARFTSVTPDLALERLEQRDLSSHIDVATFDMLYEQEDEAGKARLMAFSTTRRLMAGGTTNREAQTLEQARVSEAGDRYKGKGFSFQIQPTF